ncbi:hypothetical protein OIDMADRAFT_191664 [Oidiodendron maius Zn]|uniref:Post-GPI attachment to proteins factor 3 n=1 Tax=Oidiodendron maius (strain Zn) TaxID=913774 RepID=A0A0C3DR69_OIDMZ|nr:hypothetical protein OIDMADRAFT_191664 [Oidiodendron maius Zn]
MILRHGWSLPLLLLSILFISRANASIGDKLPEFQRCVEVCKHENCPSTAIPFFHRLLLWDCPAECDYTCQHIITTQRVADDIPIVQFHGKWPFYRFLGMQEPFSVLFSLLNFLAHRNGLAKVRAAIPESYPLRPYYVLLSYFGMASWVFSMIFHTRDFQLTEELDYLAAGASVLYSLYYTPIRIFRLDQGGKKTKSVLKAWTILCIGLYAGHVIYLKGFAWDYTYNMAANVAVGIIQNIMWSWFSWEKYRTSGRTWTTWPGLTVAWIMLAMSLELLDFPPWLGCLDAHSLWHLGTVAPTVLWYNFLLKDAQDDLAKQRLKS